MNLVRPAKCAVCQQPMFYYGDPRHENELEVEVALPKWQEAAEVKNLHSMFGVEKFYIHLRCWNGLSITLHSSDLEGAGDSAEAEQESL